ncbi:MAG: hydroxylamine reductase [Coriobacteriia bacterium]|nr:hydroxylamine reductase [Coriobacteriia bacterium]
MDKRMFCFQCEQTADGKACTVNGVCGKLSQTAGLQDQLTGELISLGLAADGKLPQAGERGMEPVHRAVLEALFTTLTNVSFDDEDISRQIEAISGIRQGIAPSSQEAAPYDMSGIWEADEDARSLKSLLLFGLRGMAAYAYHALVLGRSDTAVDAFVYQALQALGEDRPADQMLALLMELGSANLRCLELLDEANNASFGQPAPSSVSCVIEPGPFIVVSGHDLLDLELLLKQASGKGVNVYTHGEMLPAHAYPQLKAYPELKGSLGNAWQSQQMDFASLPASILFTTNCLMPVRASYADRVFTTSVAAYPGIMHIGEDKDFTPLIEKALELGGFDKAQPMPGINGGATLATGFAHGAVLAVADLVVEAVQVGAIRHFFLVGGCDGDKLGRSYYTDFVKQAPPDTVILTLGCGKYRFNDLDLGEIGGLPRFLDMGQCNDALSAIKVAVALSEAFGCTVNELPLTLVLSWYEQKAVSILLTLLSLGIQGIYLGPTLPAFVSPAVLDLLVGQFGLKPTSTPEADLANMLG